VTTAVTFLVGRGSQALVGVGRRTDPAIKSFFVPLDGAARTEHSAFGRPSLGWPPSKGREEVMNPRFTIPVALLVGAAFGALAVNGLSAQGKSASLPVLTLS
jgi:hypothetical protein